MMSVDFHFSKMAFVDLDFIIMASVDLHFSKMTSVDLDWWKESNVL